VVTAWHEVLCFSRICVCVCDLLTTVGGWSDVVFETSARGACKFSSF